jgi:hypothetical protein
MNRINYSIEEHIDLKDFTIEDCEYIHNTIGLDLICEDGEVSYIIDPKFER